MAIACDFKWHANMVVVSRPYTVTTKEMDGALHIFLTLKVRGLREDTRSTLWEDLKKFTSTSF